MKTFPKMIKEDTNLPSDEEIKQLMADRKLWRKWAIVASKDD